jgi:2-oxo-4-hydroxy-4-carboxy-5-ureidoimidazoline decarboxylase
MTLEAFNLLPENDARQALQTCCGAARWVECMVQSRPFSSENSLLQAAEACWSRTNESDWLEAFSHHPKIGDLESLAKKFASTSHLAGSEQAAVSAASRPTLEALAQGNEDYERKFSFIFIVCATGKSADEMLDLLRQRLSNDRSEELRIAAAEQMKITHLRLKKLIA